MCTVVEELFKEAFYWAHRLLSNLIFPKLEYIRWLCSEHVLTRIVTIQEYSLSLAECWHAQCTKLLNFLWLSLNYAFWFNVSLIFLFSPSSRNFHEDRSPVQEWKRMANKVNHTCNTCSYLLYTHSNVRCF